MLPSLHDEMGRLDHDDQIAEAHAGIAWMKRRRAEREAERAANGDV